MFAIIPTNFCKSRISYFCFILLTLAIVFIFYNYSYARTEEFTEGASEPSRERFEASMNDNNDSDNSNIPDDNYSLYSEDTPIYENPFAEDTTANPFANNTSSLNDENFFAEKISLNNNYYSSSNPQDLDGGLAEDAYSFNNPEDNNSVDTSLSLNLDDYSDQSLIVQNYFEDKKTDDQLLDSFISSQGYGNYPAREEGDYSLSDETGPLSYPDTDLSFKYSTYKLDSPDEKDLFADYRHEDLYLNPFRDDDIEDGYNNTVAGTIAFNNDYSYSDYDEPSSSIEPILQKQSLDPIILASASPGEWNMNGYQLADLTLESIEDDSGILDNGVVPDTGHSTWVRLRLPARDPIIPNIDITKATLGSVNPGVYKLKDCDVYLFESGANQ